MTPKLCKDLKKPARFQKLKKYLAKGGMPSGIHIETVQEEVYSLKPNSLKLPKKKK